MSKKVLILVKKHVKVCGTKNTVCAHPLFGEIYNFGNNEIAFMHQHLEPFEYTKDANLKHGQRGIHKNAKIMLNRSFDGGETWPKEERVIVFDQAIPVEEKRKMFEEKATKENTPKISKDTVFHFGIMYCGQKLSSESYAVRPYVVRSEDKGKTWSKKIVEPMNVGFTHLQPFNKMICTKNKTYRAFIVSTQENVTDTGGGVYRSVLYSSEDDGFTWQYVSEIASDPLKEIAYSYCQLVNFGSGYFASTTGAWRNWPGGNANTRWINICFSDDYGLNWTKPRIIRSFGISPYPLLLQDGRLLVIYAKRLPDYARGIYGIVSGDKGKTWSEEFTIRNGDATSSDIGYPVATQLENGDIFTGYYYTINDGLPRGGARHIAGTIFRI